MISQTTLIRKAIEQARLSDNRFRLGAVIYDKNNILSADHNYSLRSARNLHPRFRHWPGSIHAETAAILSARCDLVNSTLFVVRINKKEELMLAKPCSNCMAYIIHTGIRRVIYSIGDGFESIIIRR